MIVEVELSDLSTDNYIELEKIRKAISRQLKDEILVTPKVKLVKKGSLPQSEGKAVRVKDLRDNKGSVVILGGLTFATSPLCIHLC